MPELAINPRLSLENGGVYNFGEQRPGVGTEISNKGASKVKAATTAVNKSYQGGLTKLLKQVYNHELE